MLDSRVLVGQFRRNYLFFFRRTASALRSRFQPRLRPSVSASTLQLSRKEAACEEVSLS